MSRGIGPATLLPSTSTSPAVGASSPPMTLSSVLLPQPDGPIRHKSSPRAMSNEVSSRARTLRASPSSPNRCETFLMRMAASISGAAEQESPRAAASLLLGQELLGVELAHIGLLRQQPHLDERASQHVERLRPEPPV